MKFSFQCESCGRKLGLREIAQDGRSMQAGPGGDHSGKDPRRFPHTFGRGGWNMCLINPTSVVSHLAEIKWVWRSTPSAVSNFRTGRRQ